MSAIRSTSIGPLANTLYRFTLSAWIRPQASGLQRVFAVGAAAASPLLSLHQDASDNLVISTGATSQTIMAAAEFQTNRLYHCLVTYDTGTLYWRVSSKLVLGSGTASWASSIAMATATSCSVGSLHDSATTDPFNGHIQGIYFSRQFLGDARDSATWSIFEQASGELQGFPICISPTTPSLYPPEVMFGYTQTAAAWNAGTNRGTVTFSAAAGTALTGVGISKRLVQSPNAYIAQPYNTDGTYIYASPNGNKLVRLSMDRTTSTDLFTIGTSPGFKKEDGSLITNGGFYELYKTRTGWLFQVLDTSTNVRRFYRTPTATLQSALPIVWPVPDLMPVLTLGSDSATSLTGTLYAGRRTLGHSSFIVGTFNSGDALYIGEYDGVPTGSSLPGNIWYSTDDGATWGVFWRFQNYSASTPPTNRKLRYVHGMCQLATGEIAAVMNGITANEHLILVGPSTTDWTALNNKTVTEIIAAGAPHVAIVGTGADSDKTRWLQPTSIGNWLFGGNEETDLSRPTSGLYAVRKDGTDLTLVHRRANMQAPNRADAGGCMVALTPAGQPSVLVSTDYAPSDTTYPDYPVPQLEVRTSMDGFFWVPVAKLDLRSGRTSISQTWTTFQAGDELCIAGVYQQFLSTGSSQLSAVVAVGAETGATEDLLVLNQ